METAAKETPVCVNTAGVKESCDKIAGLADLIADYEKRNVGVTNLLFFVQSLLTEIDSLTEILLRKAQEGT